MPKTPKDSFAFQSDDHIVVVHVDDVFEDDHPYVKAYPSNFVDHDVDVIASPKRAKRIEQATAAPGEERDAASPKVRKFGTVTDQ